MKLIIAYIKPHTVEDVTLALHGIEELTGASASDIRGFGRGQARNAPDRMTRSMIDYLPRVRLEIACLDRLVPDVVAIIQRHAYTGLRGDGKIYVTSIEQATRISTGETGESAV